VANRPVGSPGVQRSIRVFLQALAAGGGKPMEHMTPAEARAVLVGAQSSVKVDLTKADVTERIIKSDGQTVKLVVVRPDGVTGTLPAFMFFHGGGWVLGDFPTHERLVRDLVAASGATAVVVEYDRSPEAHYPVAIDQAYAATRWVVAHGKGIGVDGRRLAVVGNSVGGNMAAVIALMPKDRGTPEHPVPGALVASDERRLRHRLVPRICRRPLPDPKHDEVVLGQLHHRPARAARCLRPLRASIERLKGLAPAVIQIAELDVLRDEGEAYARRLDQAGIEVTSTRYNGLIHDYGLLNPISQIPGVRSALLHASAELKKHLEAGS
jgi:acetyl esterase/lipase